MPNHEAQSIVERRAARGLLVTQQRELLLVCMALPWLEAPVWIAPGGGLEPAESWEEALIRELREETGFHAKAAGLPVWERVFDIELAPIVRVHERYFLIETARFEPVPTQLEPHERRWFRGFRWWPLAAISECADVEVGRELRDCIELATLGACSASGVEVS